MTWAITLNVNRSWQQRVFLYSLTSSYLQIPDTLSLCLRCWPTFFSLSRGNMSMSPGPVCCGMTQQGQLCLIQTATAHLSGDDRTRPRLSPCLQGAKSAPSLYEVRVWRICEQLKIPCGCNELDRSLWNHKETCAVGHGADVEVQPLQRWSWQPNWKARTHFYLRQDTPQYKHHN